MRKFLLLLVLFGLLAGPAIANAQIQIPTPKEIPSKCMLHHSFTFLGQEFQTCQKGTEVEIDQYGICCVLNVIYDITVWLFYVVVVLASLFLLVGAYHIMSAGGAPEKVATGRRFIIYAVIGAIIAMAFLFIPRIVVSIIF